MSSMRIVNEYGTPVDVTQFRAMFAFAVGETESQYELRKGNTFNINTGDIPLNTTGESAVLYIKNTGDEKLILENIIVGLGKTTGSTTDDEVKFRYYRNPDAGTIIDNELTPAVSGTSVASNKNHSVPKTLDVINYKGAVGYTINGDLEALIYTFPSSREPIPEVALELQPGNSVGFTIQPGVGNTAMNVYVAIAVFVAEELFRE